MSSKCPVIPESEVLEAHALYDFKARSSREVNFRKGDTILLYRQVKIHSRSFENGSKVT